MLRPLCLFDAQIQGAPETQGTHTHTLMHAHTHTHARTHTHAHAHTLYLTMEVVEKV